MSVSCVNFVFTGHIHIVVMLIVYFVFNIHFITIDWIQFSAENINITTCTSPFAK